jgi:flagella basal body P-ring formation protein FlgA
VFNQFSECDVSFRDGRRAGTRRSGRHPVPACVDAPQQAVAKEKRVQAFGERLEAILTELDRRDLTEVPTPALLTLALKYGEHLREEYQPLELTERESFLSFPATWEG